MTDRSKSSLHDLLVLYHILKAYNLTLYTYSKLFRNIAADICQQRYHFHCHLKYICMSHLQINMIKRNGTCIIIYFLNKSRSESDHCDLLLVHSIPPSSVQINTKHLYIFCILIAMTITVLMETQMSEIIFFRIIKCI